MTSGDWASLQREIADLVRDSPVRPPQTSSSSGTGRLPKALIFEDSSAMFFDSSPTKPTGSSGRSHLQGPSDPFRSDRRSEGGYGGEGVSTSRLSSSALQRSVDDLARELEATKVRERSFEQREKAFMSRIDLLEQQNGELRAEVDALRTTLVVAKDGLQSLKGVKATLTEERNALSAQLSEAKRAADSSGGDSGRLFAEIASLQGKLRAADEKLEAVDRDRRAAVRELEVVRLKKREQNDELDAVRHEREGFLMEKRLWQQEREMLNRARAADEERFTKLTDSMASLPDARKERDSLQAQLDKLNQWKENAKKNMETLSEAAERGRVIEELLYEERETFQAERAEWLDEREGFVASLSKGRSHLNALQRELSSLASIEDEFSEAQRGWDSERSSLLAQVRERDATIEGLSRAVDALKADVAAATAKGERDLSALRSTMQESLAKVQGEAAATRVDLLVCRERLASLEKEKESAEAGRQAALLDLSRAREEAARSNEAVRRESETALASLCESMEGDKAALRREKAELLHQLQVAEAASARLTRYRDRADVLFGDVTALSTEVESGRSEVARLKQEVARENEGRLNVERQLEELKSERDRLLREKIQDAGLAGRLRQLEDAVLDRDHAVAALQRDLRSGEATIAKYAEDYQRLARQRDRLAEDVEIQRSLLSTFTTFTGDNRGGGPAVTGGLPPRSTPPPSLSSLQGSPSKGLL